MYDFKSKLSSRGKIVKVLGHNTYSVDCGKGLQHVSGSALSKSSWQPRDDSSFGDQMLTADQDQDLVQEDVVTESDSSSDDDDEVYHDVVPAAVPRRRRRVREEHLGPTIPHRLRQRQ